jgi:hypothetical protein
MKEKLMGREISPEDFIIALESVCSKETSSDPNGWKKENPLWGHCAVVSLIAQDYFGGMLLRASLSNISEFKHMRPHYWNRLKDGREIDFTKSQFGSNYPEGLLPEEKTRGCVLSNPETSKRYKLLKSRLSTILIKKFLT